MSGKEWSSLIKRLLHAYDWELERLAKSCGVHRSTVVRWIDDGVFPKRKNWMRVVRLFHCASLEELADKVKMRERWRRIQHSDESAEPPVSNREVDQIILLVYLVIEPNPERGETIEKYPFLKQLSDQARAVLAEEFKPIAMDLRRNLEIVEEGIR